MFSLKRRLLVGVCLFGIISCGDLPASRSGSKKRHTRQDVLGLIAELNVLFFAEAQRFDDLKGFIATLPFDKGALDAMAKWRAGVQDDLDAVEAMTSSLAELSQKECDVAFWRAYNFLQTVKAPMPWLDNLEFEQKEREAERMAEILKDI